MLQGLALHATTLPTPPEASPTRLSPDGGLATGSSAHSQARSLLGCERGAVMVLGAIAALFLVALLYYLAGIGIALVARERAQDAADALALASAIGFARGMNFIVFLNLVMAALVTVLLALKVVSVLLTALSLTLAGLSLFVPGFAGALSLVENARQAVNQSHRVAKRVVNPTLRALNATADAARWSLPPTTIAVSSLKLTRQFEREGAIALPTRLSLPTQAGRYERLCDEAAGNLRALVRSGTDPIPLFGKYVGEAVDGLVGSSSRYFCKGTGSPPRHTVQFTRLLPRSPAGDRCEGARLSLEPASAACEDRARELSERQPYPDGSCGGSLACESGRRQARRVCDPSEGRSDHVWSEAQVTETVVFEGGHWRQVSFEYGTTIVHNLHRSQAMAGDPWTEASLAQQPTPLPLPCRGSRSRMRPRQALSRYAADSSRAFDEESPVCSERSAALGQLPRRATQGASRQIQYRAVRDVFACGALASEQVVLDSELTGSSDGVQADQRASMAPHTLEAGVALGSGTLALRSFTLGAAQSPRPERIQRMALLGRTLQRPPSARALDALGRLGVAQAEYYFDHAGDQPADAWMWQMNWRARLTRFRLPTSGGLTSSSSIAPRLRDVEQQLGLGNLSLEEVSEWSIH